MQTKTYSVPGIHCGHCEAAVTRELEHVMPAFIPSRSISGLKLVTVGGDGLDDAALAAAIDEPATTRSRFLPDEHDRDPRTSASRSRG